MARLSHSSLLSIMAVVWILLFVVIRLFTGAGEGSISPTEEQRELVFVGKNFFPAIGVIAFAFVCHHNSFLIFNSLKKSTLRHWKRTSLMSVGTSFLASLTVSVCGYLTFREVTKSNVLNNYSADDEIANVTRLFYALTMVSEGRDVHRMVWLVKVNPQVLTYPMEIFVARHCLYSSFCRKDETVQAHLGEHSAVSVFALCS